MISCSPSLRPGLLVLLFASFAMTATAFAHRFASEDPDPELLAYLSMGGAIADICGEDNHAHHLTNACEACLISANALAPAGIGCILLPFDLRPAVFDLALSARATGNPAVLKPPTRAPPAV